ncbi:MlaC/ttg2D family ABC transporter substrate-binding protein [Paramagnetospirillum kuznetsovii]|nr:ABC transporter substrate-binding protein [Paramagnetospirillum kuznetsovii]
MTVAILAVTLMFGQSAEALEADVAEKLVRSVVAEAGTAFNGATLSVEEKRARISALVAGNADINYISELLLGRYWRKALPEQRQVFTDLLIPYFVATYGSMIDDAKTKPDVVFRASERRDDVVIVHTGLVNSGAEPMPVDWLVVVSPAGKVGVADVVVDNISMVTTIRSDFTAVVRAGGGNVEILFDAMRKKIAASNAPR